jgi:hypothetical protein
MSSVTAPQVAKGEQIDLRVTVERARRRVASHWLQDQALPGSPSWRRLELLADTESLRWLRPSGGAVGDPAPGAAQRR